MTCSGVSIYIRAILEEHALIKINTLAIILSNYNFIKKKSTPQTINSLIAFG